MKTIKALFAVRSQQDREALEIVCAFAVFIGFILVVVLIFFFAGTQFKNTITP
jgi:hypothetical protein